MVCYMYNSGQVACSVHATLNLLPGALDAMKGPYKAPKDCLRDAVKAWLNTSPDPSWKDIVHALRNPIIGEESSARCLEKYCIQEGSEPPAGKNLSCM